MDNRNDDQELNLDDILNEFQNNGEDTSFSLEELGDALADEPAAPQEPEADDLGDLSTLIGDEPEDSEDLGDLSALIGGKPEDSEKLGDLSDLMGDEPETFPEEEELGDLDDLIMKLRKSIGW